ncbi:C40 family peptidase [Nocardia sp. NPDC004260]
MSPDATKRLGDLRELPDCAPAGLKALFEAAEGIIQNQIQLLGSGTPSKAPDLREMLRGQGIADPEDESTMIDKYHEHKHGMQKATRGIQRHDDGIVVRTEGVGDAVTNAYSAIDTSVGQLNTKVDASFKAVRTVTDKDGKTHQQLPKEIIDGLFKGVWDTLNTTHNRVHGVSEEAAAAAAEIKSDLPSYTPTGGRTPASSPTSGSTRSGRSFAPVNYGTPLSSPQLHSMTANVTDAKKRKFLETALAQVGDPYIYGAEGPNAFDCSGLVQYSAKQAGITNMPRTADAQYHATMSHPVDPNNLQPGDLIFPNAQFNGGNPGHIMIYVGNGQVVEAPHTGDHVKVIQLSQVGGFHATRF